MAENGPLQAAIERKGEGASFTTITPTEFHYDMRKTDWVSIVAGAALAPSLSFAAPTIFQSYATSEVASILTTGGSITQLITTEGDRDYLDKWLTDVRPFRSEDYSYVLNNFNRFSDEEIFDISTILLHAIKTNLINKTEIKDFEKSFYKSIKPLLGARFAQGTQQNKILKNMSLIIDWLFVLSGTTNVQTGTVSILERFNKQNMISAISVRVDKMLKQGFNLGDSTGINKNLGFENLIGPYVNKEVTATTTSSQTFRYPTINGESKISSSDLETAAENIVKVLETLEGNNLEGIEKYASIIGNDFTNNILYEGNTNHNYISSFTISDNFKYNGEFIEVDWNGWEDEETYVGKAEDLKNARKDISSTFIQLKSGLNNTSVVSFGETFDPKSIETVKISEVGVIPQPGANVGEVVESLINSAYAFYVTELGISAFENKNINQQTLFGQCVIYYSEIIARVIGTVLNNVQRFYLFLEYSALFVGGVTEDERDQFDRAKQRAANVANSAAGNIAKGGGLDASLKITEEQLKNRQKFVKQCILMYNLDTLRTNYRDHIRHKLGTNHPIHGFRAFNGRFHAIEDSESKNTNTINKMIVPKGREMKPLLEITPDIAAFLVPKIRLFRVVHKVDGNGLLETEFDFKKKENAKRIEDLLNAQFDKGNSCGIKSFDFTFEGTTPATARNDIVANLSLHFQSFQDFIEEKTAPNGEKYRFVDLIIFPVNKKNRKGVGTLRAEEYDPSIYRIRAEVGWYVPESHPELEIVLRKRGFSYEQLKNSLILTNKSFYLNMVDHDFSIKDDGTLDINISYRAYIESALKSTQFDALTTPQIRKNRENFKKAMITALDKDNCSVEEIKVIKELFQKAEEETIKKVYRSLLLRMNKNNSIFYVDSNVDDIKQFRRDGFFSRGQAPRLELSTSATKQVAEVADSMKEKAEGNTEGPRPTLKLLQDGAKDYPDEDMKEDNRINFFYLGDLIYTILDNMYNEDGTQNIDMNKTKLLLSSFGTFGAFGKEDATQQKSFNIIDIPVSVEYFYEWFTQNVIKPKKLYYPMMDFIRDLTNDLVVNLLFDSCSNRPIDTKLRFNTANFVLLSKGQDDPFMDFQANSNFPVIDLADYYGTDLPLLSDKEGEKDIQDFYNYIAIYPITTTVVHPGNGIRQHDEDKGIYHFFIGSNKGLLKKINFSKTDMQYMRESRFMRNGFDGLMQLSAVYKATLTMIGNTIYYPGMDLFIDPVGVGGPSFDPRDKDSISYKTGIGGYHLVTRVKSSITAGKFETTVEAQWHNSGAGTGRFAGRPDIKVNEDNSENSTVSDKPIVSAQEELDALVTQCTPLVSSFEDYLAQVESASEPISFAPDLSSFETPDPSQSTQAEIQENEILIDANGNPIQEEYGETLIDDTGEPVDDDGNRFPSTDTEGE